MKRVIRWSIAAMLALAGSLAVAALCWQLAKPQLTYREISDGSTAIVLLLVTTAYALAHRRRALHWVAIPLFLTSSWVLVERWSFFIGGVFKIFAPSSPEEAERAIREALGLFCLSTIAAAVAWLVVIRVSRNPSARPTVAEAGGENTDA